MPDVPPRKLLDVAEPRIRIICRLCNRDGRYRTLALMQRFTAMATLPYVREQLAASCPRMQAGKPWDPCEAELETGRLSTERRRRLDFMSATPERLRKARMDLLARLREAGGTMQWALCEDDYGTVLWCWADGLVDVVGGHTDRRVTLLGPGYAMLDPHGRLRRLPLRWTPPD